MHPFWRAPRLPTPDGARAFASLTPVKEKELIIVGPSLENESFHHAVADALEGYVRELGVASCNVAFYVPPLVPTEEYWSGFPVVVHLVDRGDPSNRTSDIGAMGLEGYAPRTPGRTKALQQVLFPYAEAP